MSSTRQSTTVSQQAVTYFYLEYYSKYFFRLTLHCWLIFSLWFSTTTDCFLQNCYQTIVPTSGFGKIRNAWLMTFNLPLGNSIPSFQYITTACQDESSMYWKSSLVYIWHTFSFFMKMLYRTRPKAELWRVQEYILHLFYENVLWETLAKTYQHLNLLVLPHS